MNKFVEGQKVICISKGFEPIENNKIYEVDRCTDKYVYLTGKGGGGYYHSRFQTIIESIEDVIPGMTLTVVDAVDRDSVGWMKKYRWTSYNGWDNYFGKEVSVKCVEAGKYIMCGGPCEHWYTRFGIEMFKEYPGNVGKASHESFKDLLNQVKESCWPSIGTQLAKDKQTAEWIDAAFKAITNLAEKETKMEKKYRITEEYRLGITLADIYEKKPASCSNWDREFSRFLKTDRTHIDENFINSPDCFLTWKDWLLEKGFVEEVKPAFEPFDLTIRVESEDMLREIWHRFNTAFIKVIQDGQPVGRPKGDTTDDAFENIDHHCKRLGLKK